MFPHASRIGLPALVLLVVLAAPGPAPGQTITAPTLPEGLMQICNADAGARELAGEARRVFMRRCLSGLATPSAGATITPGSPTPEQAEQRERMRGCNAEAGTRSLLGQQWQRFMEDCMG